MIVGALAMSFPTLAGNEDRIGSAGASEMLVNPWAVQLPLVLQVLHLPMV